jgi:hypothetical protein
MMREEMASRWGDVAQLGERLHGMQEVGGSNPPISTTGLPLAGRPPLGRGRGWCYNRRCWQERLPSPCGPR